MDGKAVHQRVDQSAGVLPGVGGQVGVTGGGENGTVAEDLLHLQEIDPGLDQMGGITVAKTVGADLFLIRTAARLSAK